MYKVNRIVTNGSQSEDPGLLAKQALTLNSSSQGHSKEIAIAKPFKPKSLMLRKASKREKQEVLSLLKTRMILNELYPPPYDATRSRVVKRRYQSAEAAAISSAAFSIGQGHNQFLVVTVLGGTDTGVPYVDCWRIKKISIWCISSDENSTNVTLQPNAIDIDSNCFNDREAAFTCSQEVPLNLVIWP